MMTSSQIRQSFLDFFKSKQHTIVPSSSLMPDSPNLLFTNAGMNQFVPIFLGQTKCPYTPGRAADTQKCIRAGGKHNDLDDVGLDTYHHTFFEMLGNWSFGDYFKKDAIAWAWELVIEVWKFPPQRIYATIYQPDKSKNDPAERDEEAWNFWAEKFRSVGLDPDIHIVNGNKKDNFWMMGETGPCGPCTEIHVDLRPGPAQTDLEAQKSGRLLVNGSDARCIEIWNNVFIQYNANPDGTFTPLPAQHVDTGMGFERVTSIIQGTRGLTDFQNAKISNYETDVFRPIFDAIEKLSGKKYGSTLPKAGSTGDTEQEKVDVAFRVIADHIRTLSFAIADGIQPGNNDRNYVLRRILRRAVRYGRTLGFHEPFFYKLVDVLAEKMGDVFPEIRVKKNHVEEVIQREEEAFNKTLDRGIAMFEENCSYLPLRQSAYERIRVACEQTLHAADRVDLVSPIRNTLTSFRFNKTAYQQAQSDLRSLAVPSFLSDEQKRTTATCEIVNDLLNRIDDLVLSVSPRLNAKLDSEEMKDAIADARARFDAFLGRAERARRHVAEYLDAAKCVSAEAAFVLYDTYGFPLDLTELMGRERGLKVDRIGFEKLMEEQRTRAREAQKKTVIEVSNFDPSLASKFVGYDALSVVTTTKGIVGIPEKPSTRKSIVTEQTPFYSEMGGQVGDQGMISSGGKTWRVINTLRADRAICHVLSDDCQGFDELNTIGTEVELRVDMPRRNAIQRHHTVTHLLHWALHEVVSKEASQKGSFVGPDKLTFDFNSAALTPEQVADIEKLVNERILENAGVSWTEVPHAEVKNRPDVMQFFGDKYGDTVRVVQIGGAANKLDGYSMELCGGTHTRATGEIGLFRIVSESAVAAGVRRIEAVAGLTAYDVMKLDRELIKAVAGKVNSPIHELEKKIESLLAQQKALEHEVRVAMQRNASNAASELLKLAQTVNGIPLITHNLGDANGDFLQAIADALKGRFKGVVVLGGGSEASVALVATVSADFTAKVQAGKIIQAIAPIVGGKGGGKPDNARGGGKDVAKLDEALAKVKTLF